MEMGIATGALRQSILNRLPRPEIGHATITTWSVCIMRAHVADDAVADRLCDFSASDVCAYFTFREMPQTAIDVLRDNGISGEEIIDGLRAALRDN